MNSITRKRPLPCIALAILGAVFPIAAEEVTGSWHTSGGVQMFQFETSALKGRFIAGDQRELPRGYARHGLRGLTLQPAGRDPHPPVGKVGGKRRHQGMLNLYRVYSATESFGALRDEDADIEEAADGANPENIFPKKQWQAGRLTRPILIAFSAIEKYSFFLSNYLSWRGPAVGE